MKPPEVYDVGEPGPTALRPFLRARDGQLEALCWMERDGRKLEPRRVCRMGGTVADPSTWVAYCHDGSRQSGSGEDRRQIVRSAGLDCPFEPEADSSPGGQLLARLICAWPPGDALKVLDAEQDLEVLYAACAQATQMGHAVLIHFIAQRAITRYREVDPDDHKHFMAHRDADRALADGIKLDIPWTPPGRDDKCLDWAGWQHVAGQCRQVAGPWEALEGHWFRYHPDGVVAAWAFDGAWEALGKSGVGGRADADRALALAGIKMFGWHDKDEL